MSDEIYHTPDGTSDEEYHTLDESSESGTNRQEIYIDVRKPLAYNIFYALSIGPILYETRILIHLLISKIPLIPYIVNQICILIGFFLGKIRIMKRKLYGDKESSDLVKDENRTTEHDHSFRIFRKSDTRSRSISNQVNKIANILNDLSSIANNEQINENIKKLPGIDLEEIEKEDSHLTMNKIFKNDKQCPYALRMRRHCLTLLADESSLNKSLNRKLLKRTLKIFKNIFHLMKQDLKYNVYPLIFNQIIVAFILETLLPLLELNICKNILEKMNCKIPEEFNTFLDVAKIPRDAINDTSISNIMKIFYEHFKEMKINDNKWNRRVAKLYEKNLEYLLKILDKDFKENNTMVILRYLLEEKFFEEILNVYKKIFKNIIYLKMKQNGKKDTFSRFLKSLKSKRQENFCSKDEDSSKESEEEKN